MDPFFIFIQDNYMKKLLFLLLTIIFIISCNQPTDPIIEDPIIEEPELEPEPIPEPVYVQLFYDNVENGIKNWTTDGSWLIVTGYSYSLTRSWAERNGNYLADQDYSLVSQVFDFTGYEDIILSFWQVYDFEENYDFGYVEYSIDGSTWIRVSTITGTKYYWTPLSISIPVSNEATFQIRFRIVTDSTVHLTGWFIDEIKIEGIEIEE